MDAWATHQPMLFNFVSKTKGNVLELGTGYFSTPTLHYMLSGTGRLLYSYEYKADWLEKFRHYESDTHKLFHVTDWDIIDIEKNWSVAFVDHSPGERRIMEIHRLKDFADFVIVHDSEALCYGYEPYFAEYKYRFDFKDFTTGTTVISNFLNPQDFL